MPMAVIGPVGKTGNGKKRIWSTEDMYYMGGCALPLPASPTFHHLPFSYNSILKQTDIHKRFNPLPTIQHSAVVRHRRRPQPFLFIHWQIFLHRITDFTEENGVFVFKAMLLANAKTNGFGSGTRAGLSPTNIPHEIPHFRSLRISSTEWS